MPRPSLPARRGQVPGGPGEAPPKALRAKIVMAGESCVGKTSILQRYTERGPTASYIATVGIDFKVKTISLNDTTIQLQIWDTAGQERFHTFTTSFFRGAHGFVLVYDVTSTESFQGIAHWMKDIYEILAQVEYLLSKMLGSRSVLDFGILAYTGSPQIMNKKTDETVDIILLGNKCDKEMERVIPKNRGEKTTLLDHPILDCVSMLTSKSLEQLAWEYGIPFFETSAKDNINIDDAFLVLAEEILNKNSCVLLDLDVVDLHEKARKKACCRL